MIPTATRLMHSRHVSRRASSCFRSSCSGCSQRCSASACGRVIWRTNRGSGNEPLASIRGAASNSAWTPAGSGMRAGHERASLTNCQHSGVNLTVTSGGYTTSTKARARDSGCGRPSGQAGNPGDDYPAMRRLVEASLVLSSLADAARNLRGASGNFVPLASPFVATDANGDPLGGRPISRRWTRCLASLASHCERVATCRWSSAIFA
jgi:hypothetical protein